MAYSHGKNAILKVTSGGTLRDISPYLTVAGQAQSADTAEVETLGDSAKEYLAGLLDGTFKLEGIFDPTPDGWLNVILGGAGTAFEYHPQGTATGNPKYSGSVICTSYDVNTDIGDAGKFTGELQITGPVTRALN